MIEAVTTSPLFGIVLCIGTFQIGRWVQKKTGLTLANPLVIAILLCIGVLPQCRGMGSQVLAALLQTLEQEVTLQVASDNTAALRLYQKFGFQRQSALSYWYDLDPMFTGQ